jgi:hypothetical protein
MDCGGWFISTGGIGRGELRGLGSGEGQWAGIDGDVGIGPDLRD